MSEEELYQKFLKKIADCDKAASLHAKLSFSEFSEKMKPYINKIKTSSQNYRMVQSPDSNSKIPNFGTVMSLEEFKRYSENLKLSDYDGYGEYVNDDGTLTGINIYPSDVVDGKIRNDFNKIAWFNR